MSRPPSVTRSATTLLTSRLLVAGIALAFLGVSTRLLSLEEMAVFALYNTLCGMLTAICSLGLLASCVKLIPGLLASTRPTREAEASQLIRLSIVVYIAGASIVTLGIWLAASPLSRLFLKTPDYAPAVRVAAVAALCFGLYEASQLLLAALQRFGPLGSYNVAAALAQRTFSLLLFFPYGLKGYLAGFAIGSLAGAILGSTHVIPFLREPGSGGESGQRPDASRPGALLAYSMPFYADGYLRYSYMQADQVLVGIFLTPADLSIYFVAKRFIQYCQVLVSSFVDPLGARVSELKQSGPDALRRTFATSLRYFVLLFVPLSALLASLSPFLLLLVGGARYAGGVIPLALLFLSLPFFAVFSHLAAFIYALGRPSDRLKTNLVSTAAQAVAILGLMPLLALPGLALARMLGFGIAAAYARKKVTRYLPGQAAAGVLRAALWCLLPAWAMACLILVPHLLVGNAALLPLYAIPAICVCLAGYLLVVLTPQDRAALASLVPGQGRAARSFRTALSGAVGQGAGSTPI